MTPRGWWAIGGEPTGLAGSPITTGQAPHVVDAPPALLQPDAVATSGDHASGVSSHSQSRARVAPT